MSNEKRSQYISISGGNLPGSQIGQAGGGLNQTQHITQNSIAEPTSQKEAVALLAEIENLIKASNLTPTRKEETLRYLEAAQAEVQSQKPDKSFAEESLRKVSGVLREADGAIEASQDIWQKVKPKLHKLLLWLGAAVDFLS